MIPAGYMAKNVVLKPDWLKTDQVFDIYSVSSCISKDFCDFYQYWKHNGFYFFNSPQIIKDLANEQNIDLDQTHMFYLEVFELQYDEDLEKWLSFEPEKSFQTKVLSPNKKKCEGFDIVSFAGGGVPDCSYLSCNSMACSIPVNKHCLLPSFAEAKALLDKNSFKNCEPGPSRVFAVYSIPKV